MASSLTFSCKNPTTEFPSVSLNGKFTPSNGKTMQVTPHMQNKHVLIICGVITLVIGGGLAISLVAGFPGYALGGTLWGVGAAQGSAGMIIAGKVFVALGALASLGAGLIGSVVLTIIIISGVIFGAGFKLLLESSLR